MKFISELDVVNNPADAEEMNRAVFGHNYPRGRNGEPLEMGLCSDWSIRNGKTPVGVLMQHLLAIGNEKTGGSMEKSDMERDRIRALQRAGGQPVTV